MYAVWNPRAQKLPHWENLTQLISEPFCSALFPALRMLYVFKWFDTYIYNILRIPMRDSLQIRFCLELIWGNFLFRCIFHGNVHQRGAQSKLICSCHILECFSCSKCSILREFAHCLADGDAWRGRSKLFKRQRTTYRPCSERTSECRFLSFSHWRSNTLTKRWPGENATAYERCIMKYRLAHLMSRRFLSFSQCHISLVEGGRSSLLCTWCSWTRAK